MTAARAVLSLAALALLVHEPPARALDPGRALGQYTRRTWSLEQGLPQSSVNDITQDRDGYLWVATFGGLVRFDGVRTVVVSSAREPGLPSDRITALAVDDTGALWVGTEGAGLAVRRGRAFERVPLAAERPPSVTRLLPARDGGVWAATNVGLFLVSGSGAARRFRCADGLQSEVVMTVARGPRGETWVGTHQGLCVIEGERCVPRFASTIDHESVLAIETGRAGTFVGTQTKLFEVAGDTVRELAAGRGVPVRAIFEDSAGSVWAGLDPGGLVRLRPREESLEKNGGPAGDAVKSLFEDREGNLWVGSTGRGLVKLSDGRAVGIGIESRGSALSTLPIVSDGADGAFVGTRCEGVAHVFPSGVEFLSEKGVPFRDCVWSLLLGDDRSLWIGTFGRGLALRRRDGVFERLDGPPSPGRVVRALVRGSDGAILAGGDDGVFRVDPTTRRFARVPGTEGLEVYVLDAAPDGSLWIGSNKGLHLFSSGGHRSWSTATGLSSDAVRAVLCDPSGVLWLGTYGGGLNRIEGDRVTVFGSGNGLFEDVVSRIVEDSSGRFWMTGNRGVTRVERERLEAAAASGGGSLGAELFDASTGMRTSECNGGGQPAGFLGADGRFWVPTVDGISTFDTRRETRNAVPPPVRIEEVLVGGRPVDGLRSLVLPADARNLEIRFTALSFKRPEKVRFRTRLAGLDEDWVDAGARRVAYYPYLPPGSFRFEVTAANDDGVWSERGAALPFTRTARFVETPWFPVVLVLSVALLAGAALVAARRVNRLREERLERVVRERTEELSRLIDIAEKINRGSRLEEVLDHIYESLHGVIPYDRVGLALLDEDRLVLRALWSRTEAQHVEIAAGYEAPLATSSLKRVLEEGRPRILDDLPAYLAAHPESESTRRIVQEGVRSSLTLPLRADGKPVGIVFFSSFRPGTYDESHVRILEGIVGHLSMVVTKTRLYEDLLATKAHLEDANAELGRLVTLDPLTGLLNRRAFDEMLARELKRASRARTPVTILMIDVDLFKAFNDRYGHSAGDVCLRQVAAALASRIQRAGDAVARWGGEEFAGILSGCGPQAARTIAEEVREAVERRRIPHEGSPSGFVTVSVGGGCRIPEAEDHPDDLLRRADSALYEAKRAGRNRSWVET